MRQLYEDIHDMDLEELSEDDEETLGDYQKEKFETIIANENYEQIYTSRSSLKTCLLYTSRRGRCRAF